MEFPAREPGEEDSVAPNSERALTDAEIEAVVAAEGSTPPEADQPAPQLAAERHEPGRIAWGRWFAWFLVGLVILAAINAYR